MTADLWERAADLLAPAAPASRWASPMTLRRELDPATRSSPALELIDSALVSLWRDGGRLLVAMPPQEGKSTLVSHSFPRWVLTENPDTRIAIVSYADEIARTWGSNIRLDALTFNGHDGMTDLGMRLREDSRAAGRWQIDGRAGGVYCVGIGGPLTGRPVDLLIIDDPLKDLEQAQSPIYRERAWRWWQAVAVPRMGPDTKVVLVQTRWHEDDLAGRLLATDAPAWRTISIPAISEGDDELGRPVGQGLQSVRGARDWQRIREQVGEYVWGALYQQRPTPQEGGLFKRDWLRYWTRTSTGYALDDRQVHDRDGFRFITVDLAASTRTSADYTVAGAWLLTSDGQLLLLDGLRERVTPEDHWRKVKALRDRTGSDVVFVEPAMFGTTLAYEAGRDGIPLRELRADTDKWTRALPASARASQGRLWMPRESWVEDWVRELLAFPNAAHDDVVDVVAYAAKVAADHTVLPSVAPRRSAPRELDFMNVPL